MALHPVNFIGAILCLFHLADGERASISLSVSSVPVGGSAQVTCHTEISDQERSPVTVLMKHFHHSEEQRIAEHFPALLPKDHLGDLQPVELATNHFLNEDATRTGRYRCSYRLAAPGDYSKIDYELAIENVSTEDFGYYSCRMSVGNQTVQSDAKLLQVVSPVTHVRWLEYDLSSLSWHQLEPNVTIRVDEDKFLLVKCESEGGFPKPSHSVQVVDGREKPDKGIDVTSLFSEKATCPLGKGPKGLQKLLMSSSLSPTERIPQDRDDEQGDDDDDDEVGDDDDDDDDGNDDGGGDYVANGLRMTYSYHEKFLVCSAAVSMHPDEKMRKKSAWLFVELIEFRPKFTCPDRILAEPNSQNFSITCTIRARPGVKKMKIFHNGSMPVEQRNGEYMADTEVVNGTNEEEVRFTLVIFRVSWRHFGRYELVAVNDLGNSTHVVELIRDIKNQKSLSQKSYAGSSSSSSSSVIRFGLNTFVVLTVAVTTGHVTRVQF